MSPTSPDEERAAAAESFLRDLAAVCAAHGRMLWAQFDDGTDEQIPIVRADPVCSMNGVGALVMFDDGEVRFEPELRDPEDVVAQVPVPTSGHARLAAARRLAALTK